MELLIIGTLGLFFLFVVSRYIFNKLHWNVRNYRREMVPYNIGIVFYILLTMDYLFFTSIVTHTGSYLFLTLVWIFGLIDDIYGQPFPKGIKGHFSSFFTRREVTTGFIKAIGIGIAALLYLIVNKTQLSMFFVLFFFLILYPHTMNLLDTKPLRVLKMSIFTIFVPLVITVGLTHHTVFILLLLLVWGLFESTRRGMLGDNGAMLIGAVGAVVAYEVIGITFTYIMLSIVLFLTWFAEKGSIQEMVERTPILKEFDQLGRTE